MNAPVRFSPLAGERVEPPDLGLDEIHLWTSRLDLAPERVEALASLLSPAERERAARYRSSRHRRRFEVSWGLTRALLAAYQGEAPQDIRISYGAKGRPALDEPTGEFEFNLSHSGDRLALGVRRRGRLGIDIERLRPVEEARGIARRFFSRREYERLETLADHDRLDGFFNCWTRKEALVKATGEGVFAALARFEVSLAPGEPARLLTLDGSSEGTDRWSLFHLHPAPGVVGALATQGPAPVEVRAWSVEPDRQMLAGVD